MIIIIAQLLKNLADSYEFNIGISGLCHPRPSRQHTPRCLGEFVKLFVGVVKDKDSQGGSWDKHKSRSSACAAASNVRPP